MGSWPVQVLKISIKLAKLTKKKKIFVSKQITDLIFSVKNCMKAMNQKINLAIKCC